MIKDFYSIAIIEDDMVSQFATRYSLEQFANETFAIQTFDSAEVALEHFMALVKENTTLPDIIFLDLGLDKMDGWSFIDALQKLLEKTSPPKIYILSAFGKSQDRALAQDHPWVLDYIDKPLTRNRLQKIFTEIHF